MAERRLQPGHPLQVALDRSAFVKRAEKFRRVAQFLEGDAQFVTMRRRLAGKMSSLLERLLAAFGEQAVGKLGDRTEKHRRALGDRLLAPAFALDPRAYLEEQRRVTRRGDRFTRVRVRMGALLARRT